MDTRARLRTGLMRLWIVISLAWLMSVGLVTFGVTLLAPAHAGLTIEIGVVAALAPPVSTFVVGWGLAWAISGFREG
ncbi:MAG TPA: hypothetical protein VKU90_10320 [Caulobacteraceae bacterium]|nr:hypothetical protein [Caulobacteraceae bacterium]